MKDQREDFLDTNRDLKRAILQSMFDFCDTVYLHCAPHQNLSMGKRSLSQKERELGILLVFGPHSIKNLQLKDNLIKCQLEFKKWEQVIIPIDAINQIFDKEGHVIMEWAHLSLLNPNKNTNYNTSTSYQNSNKKTLQDLFKNYNHTKPKSKIPSIEEIPSIGRKSSISKTRKTAQMKEKDRSISITKSKTSGKKELKAKKHVSGKVKEKKSSYPKVIQVDFNRD